VRLRSAATLGLVLLLAACGGDSKSGGGGFFSRIFGGTSSPTLTCPEVTKS